MTSFIFQVHLRILTLRFSMLFSTDIYEETVVIDWATLSPLFIFVKTSWFWNFTIYTYIVLFIWNRSNVHMWVILLILSFTKHFSTLSLMNKTSLNTSCLNRKEKVDVLYVLSLPIIFFNFKNSYQQDSYKINNSYKIYIALSQFQ